MLQVDWEVKRKTQKKRERDRERERESEQRPFVCTKLEDLSVRKRRISKLRKVGVGRHGGRASKRAVRGKTVVCDSTVGATVGGHLAGC